VLCCKYDINIAAVVVLKNQFLCDRSPSHFLARPGQDKCKQVLASLYIIFCMIIWRTVNTNSMRHGPCGSRSFYKIEDFCKHRCYITVSGVQLKKQNNIIGRHTTSDSAPNVDFKRFAPSPKEAVRVYDNLPISCCRYLTKVVVSARILFISISSGPINRCLRSQR